MKRIGDVILALLLLAVCAGPMLLLAVLIRLTSRGPVLHWSQRVGQNNRLFWMPKFRTMRSDTPQVASHLLENPEAWMTPLGSFLRRTSLDELPQLWSILKGEMSFVGPRPALFNQHDLIEMRTRAGVHRLPVGLTGWAQINGRDESPLAEKVQHDRYYLAHRSLLFDLKIMLLTAGKVLLRQGTRVPPQLLGDDSLRQTPLRENSHNDNNTATSAETPGDRSVKRDRRQAA